MFLHLFYPKRSSKTELTGKLKFLVVTWNLFLPSKYLLGHFIGGKAMGNQFLIALGEPMVLHFVTSLFASILSSLLEWSSNTTL